MRNHLESLKCLENSQVKFPGFLAQPLPVPVSGGGGGGGGGGAVTEDKAGVRDGSTPISQPQRKEKKTSTRKSQGN